MKNTALNVKNQALITKPDERAHQYPESFIRDLSNSERSVLNYILYNSKKYSRFFQSQATIAKRVGITQNWCNQIIKKLCSLGLLIKEVRPSKTCIYTVSPYFSIPHIKSALSHLLPALHTLAVALLFHTQYLYNQQTPPLVRQNSFYVEKHDSENNQHKLILGVNRLYKVNNLRSIYPENSIDGPPGVSSSNTNMATVGSFIPGVIMNAAQPELYGISKSIQEITELSLTEWGRIKLSAFPDEAIAHARSVMQFVTRARDPFSFFFKTCLQFCNDNGTKPHWKWMYTLQRLYKAEHDIDVSIDVTLPFVRSPKNTPAITNQPMVVTPTRTTSWKSGRYDKEFEKQKITRRKTNEGLLTKELTSKGKVITNEQIDTQFSFDEEANEANLRRSPKSIQGGNKLYPIYHEKKVAIDREKEQEKWLRARQQMLEGGDALADFVRSVEAALGKPLNPFGD
jgi:hypothetical protein